MARRTAIAIWTILLLAVSLARWGTVVEACGPFPIETTFVSRAHPDAPLQAFWDGQLGVLLHSYWRVHLLVAYRVLTGRPLTEEEKRGLEDYFGVGGPAAETDSALNQWLAARRLVPGAGEELKVRPLRERDYSFYVNCTDSGLLTAAETLRQRISEYGASSLAVREWLRAQDMVFSNCGAAGAIPPEAPDLPPKQRADREYQTGAALFYSGRYEEAEQRFQKIAADTQSDWNPLAHLLVARARIRRSWFSSGDSENPDPELLRSARIKLIEILGNPALARWHEAARDLRVYADIRLDPKSALDDLSDVLLTGSRPQRFVQDLRDWAWLMDRATKSDHPLVDWVQRFQYSYFAQSVDRWRRAPSLLNLLAAATQLPNGSSEVEDVIEALGAVPPESPAWPTAAFHRARLLSASHPMEARAVIDQALQVKSLSASSRNLFQMLRFPLSASLEEFRETAALKPVRVNWAWNELPELLGEPRLTGGASRTLTVSLPQRILVRLALDNQWPDSLRRELAQAVWVRAALLEDWESASRLVAVLRRLEPSSRELLQAVEAARTDEDRRFAAAYALLRLPGWHPYASSGVPRQTAARRIDDFRDNWWCAFEKASESWPTHYRYTEGQDGEWESWRPRNGASPLFLSEEDIAQAGREWSRLTELETAPNVLAQAVLDYGKTHRQDPRVPEALHRVVRATRYGCAKEGTTHYSKQAFLMLHRNYPNSPWARKTKYWY